MADQKAYPQRPLAIVVKNYPFINGEPFFHAELTELSKRFSHILIVSRHGRTGDEQTHFVLPDNVVHIDLNIRQSFKSRINSLMRAVFNGSFFRLFRDLKTSGTVLHPLTVKTALAYDEMAMLSEKCLTVKLSSIGRSADEYLWYSYWCDDSAYLLALWKHNELISKALSRAHGYDLYAERHPFNYLPYRSFICAALDHIVCISAHGQQYLSTRYPEREEKFNVFRLGVNDQEFLPLPDRQVVRIVSVSTIIPLKNLETLIHALEMWDGQELEWHHLGQGKVNDYQESIIALAHNLLSKKPNVTFNFHGFIAPDLVLNKLNELCPHALVNTSIFEGIPVSMMEACSKGIPVIGPRIYGVPEIIVDGLNGFMFFPIEPMELARTLKRLADLSDKQYDDMRINAYTSQQQHFNAALNHQRFGAFMQDVANSN